MTYIDLLIIYSIGIVICTVIICTFADWMDDNIFDVWIIGVFWPILIIYFFIVFLFKFPYWIGKGIRTCFKYKRVVSEPLSLDDAAGMFDDQGSDMAQIMTKRYQYENKKDKSK